MPARRFARQWAAHLAAVTTPVRGEDELVDVLEDLLDRVLIALANPAWDPTIGENLGIAVADLGFRSPAVIDASLPTLCEVCRHAGTTPEVLTSLASRFGLGVGRGLTSESVTPHAADGFEIAFRHASVAMSIGDARGRIIDANPAFERLVGYPLDQLRGLDGFDLAGDTADVERRRIFDELAGNDSGAVRFESEQPRPDGTTRWVGWTITQCVSADGERAYLLGFGQDLTEQHTAAQRLHWQAHHDPLTGLTNRRGLHTALHSLVGDAHPGQCAAVCALDVDGFKAVNDTYGHAVGDQILVELAERLRRCLSTDQELLARLGGDEFIVVLPPSAVDRARKTIDLLHAAVVDPFALPDGPISVSVSIGAVVTPLTGRRVPELLAEADDCLYQAKALGKNRWILRTDAQSGTDSTDSRGRPEIPR
ncbi:diguanylate cyclase domain-containing protein [Nocardia sp. NPDC057272]|uniref:diguanylate cyclase domain-containing protein n=1 Tax=Nocardia sp. NPDC057272 TaxID=3346079 RepID=UPI003644AF2D